MTAKNNLNLRKKEMMSKEIFEPIEGIAIETYASLGAALASGMADEEFAGILGQVGINREQYDRIGEMWNERMAKDTTFALATTYGTAFAAGGWGQFGEAGQQVAMGTVDESEEPMPFEKYCEIQGAMNAWTNKGEDVNAKLEEVFKIKAIDYANIGAWWGSKMVSDNSLFEQLDKLTQKYEKQYS